LSEVLRVKSEESMIEGKVKKKEYLMFLVEERETEATARMNGLNILPKSIEEIRAAFEQEHGSIFMNI